MRKLRFPATPWIAITLAATLICGAYATAPVTQTIGPSQTDTTGVQTLFYQSALAEFPGQITLSPKFLTVLSFYDKVNQVASGDSGLIKTSVEDNRIFLSTASSSGVTDLVVTAGGRINLFTIHIQPSYTSHYYIVRLQPPIQSSNYQSGPATALATAQSTTSVGPAPAPVAPATTGTPRPTPRSSTARPAPKPAAKPISSAPTLSKTAQSPAHQTTDAAAVSGSPRHALPLPSWATAHFFTLPSAGNHVVIGYSVLNTSKHKTLLLPASNLILTQNGSVLPATITRTDTSGYSGVLQPGSTEFGSIIASAVGPGEINFSWTIINATNGAEAYRISHDWRISSVLAPRQ